MELLHITAGLGNISVKGENGLASKISINSVTYAQGGKVNNHYFSGGTLTMGGLGWGRLANYKNMTIALWLRPKTTGTFFGPDGELAVRQYSCYLYSNRNNLHYSWYNDNAGTVVGGEWGPYFPDNVWTHFCMINKNGIVSTYINGELKFSLDWSHISRNFSARDGGYTLLNFNVADIDDVHIYNHAISEEKLKELVCPVAFKLGCNSGTPKDTITNYPLTKTGSIAFVQDEKSPMDGGYWQFNGDGYILCPTTTKLKYGFTWNLWAYMDDWSRYDHEGDNMRIISCFESGGWGIDSDTKQVQFGLRDGAANAYKDCLCDINYEDLASGWHMLTCVFDQTKATMYIDGRLRGTSADFSGAPNAYLNYNSGNTVMIGAETNGTTTSCDGCYFTGRITGVCCYANPLTSREIANLYYGYHKLTSDTFVTNAFTAYSSNITSLGRNLLTQEIVTKGKLIRYIKDTVNGNTMNSGSHWNGIRIYDHNGTNISSSAISRRDGSISSGTLTGGVDSTTHLLNTALNGSNWNLTNSDGQAPLHDGGVVGAHYQLIDLGSLKTVSCIEVHHYGEDNRYYNGHKLEVSRDGVNWETIRNASIEGGLTEYPVTTGGLMFYLTPDDFRISASDNYIHCRNVSQRPTIK